MGRLRCSVNPQYNNLIRKHSGVDGLTPAQAAGIEEKRWSLENVIDYTDSHMWVKAERTFEIAFAELKKP